jgi:predicted lipoprotein
MRQLLRPAAVLSAAAVVALAGCGGSDYPASADAVCKTYNKKINAVAKPRSTAQLSTYIGQVTPLFRQAIAKLQAVKPPSDKKSAYNSYVSVLSQEADTLDQAGAAAKTNPRQAVTLILTAQQKLSAQEKQNAKNAGLKSCAAGT